MARFDARISVIVPAYNAAAYLGEAIGSARAQERAAAEIVVVDDGSTDQTAAVAESFGAEVRVLRQPQRGPGAARNAGVRLATGDFLAFLDADDLWAPAKLALQMAAVELDPDLAIVFAHVRNFLSPELSESQRAQIHCPPDPMPGMIPSALLVRAAAFFPFEEELAVGELIPWLARAEERNLKRRMLPDVLVSRRLHTGNLGRRESPRAYLAAVKKVLDRRRSQP